MQATKGFGDHNPLGEVNSAVEGELAKREKTGGKGDRGVARNLIRGI